MKAFRTVVVLRHNASTSTAPSSQTPTPPVILGMYEPRPSTFGESAPRGPARSGGDRRTSSVQIAAGAPLADAIPAFLSRCLACEAHQPTALALWVIYTWCFEHFSTTVYLAFFQRFFAGFSRLSRDEIPIRNVIGGANFLRLA